jgi:murein DD-endopeptidase MepM/ murein hydrolase activator NlpD
MAGITAGLVLIVAAADVRADPPPTTTTDVTTSTQATTTTATTTSSTTTTAPVTTSPITTAPATTTDIQTAPARVTATVHTFGPGCAVAAVALIRPRAAPLAIGPIASHLSYPADGSTVTAAGVDIHASGCGRGLARLDSLSLFGKTITAATVTLRIGTRRSVAIHALRVLGRPTASTPGKRVPLASWGYLVIDPPTSALAVHLLEPRAGLSAGTVILVAVVAGSSNRATARHRKRRRRARHEPLKVTPPLALRHYTFPVLEPAEYIDTYGAFRSDVPGNWHHGDDIFAPLGTPVVAVATGTINRIGWEHLGGWRLWVRDAAGDEFYYAHLSGYTAGDLHSNKVKAGQVIGFIGNTGDAFTTSPHLHFEIHPRSLLHLGYDGAVDPTTYLDHWTHLKHIRAPAPVHPRLPTDPPLRSEARYVFRELLAARHLIGHAPKASQRPHVEVPSGANGFPLPLEPTKAESAAPIPTSRNPGGLPPLVFALLVGLGSLLLFALTAAIAKRRRHEADT